MRGKKRGAVFAILVAGSIAAVCGVRGCGDEPEDKLAVHLDQLTKIMKGGLGSPNQGVTRLFDYNQANISEMLGLWGEIIATLDRIEDDRTRERRGRRIVQVLRPALDRFGAAAEPFFERVQRDPEAKRTLEKRLARLKPLEELFQSLGRAARRLGH
jgi:hypothetical protein